MPDTVSASSSQTAPDVATALGFRRIEQVRVVVGGRGTVAEVTGITHRYPRTFRISLAAAARLANAGVPVRLERSGEAAGPHGVR